MSKLKLISENTELDVTDVSFTFEYNTPLTAESVEANAYTYPAELPTSDKNQTFFNHIHLPESRQSFKEWACRVQFADDLLLGKLILLRADRRKYMTTIIRNGWDKDVLDKNLRTIDLGGNRTGITDMAAHALDVANKTVETADYTFFPIYNPNFYDGSDNASFANIINRYSTVTGEFVGVIDMGGGIYENPSTFVPFPYLVYVLRQIAKSFGKILRGSFIADADIKQATIYNTFCLDEFRTDGWFTANFYATSINLQNHVPDITIKEFLNSLLGLNIAIYLTDTEMVMDWKDTKLNAPESDDWTDITERDPFIEPFDANTPTGYTFKIETDTADTALSTISEQTLQAEKVKGAVPYIINLPATGEQGDLYFLMYENRWITPKADGTYDNTNLDKFNIGYANTFVVGTGAKNIDIKIGTLRMSKHIPTLNPIPDTVGLDYLPEANQIGNGKEYNLMQEGKENPYGFKILFYRGFQENYTGDLYPLGTSDVWCAKSATLGPVGSRSMLWGGTYGIYAQSWKKWLSFLSSAKAVNFQLALDSTRLGRLDLTKKIRIDRANYLFEKITVSVSTKGIRKATARAIKL